jgi:hypothetical protein
MNWGEKKLLQVCREEMGLDPVDGWVFLFFNRKQDQLKIFFLDENGSQQFTKLLPNSRFLLPVAQECEKFVRIDQKKIDSLFR